MALESQHRFLSVTTWMSHLISLSFNSMISENWPKKLRKGAATPAVSIWVAPAGLVLQVAVLPLHPGLGLLWVAMNNSQDVSARRGHSVTMMDYDKNKPTSKSCLDPDKTRPLSKIQNYPAAPPSPSWLT